MVTKETAQALPLLPGVGNSRDLGADREAVDVGVNLGVGVPVG